MGRSNKACGLCLNCTKKCANAHRDSTFAFAIFQYESRGVSIKPGFFDELTVRAKAHPSWVRRSSLTWVAGRQCSGCHVYDSSRSYGYPCQVLIGLWTAKFRRNRGILGSCTATNISMRSSKSIRSGCSNSPAGHHRGRASSFPLP